MMRDCICYFKSRNAFCLIFPLRNLLGLSILRRPGILSRLSYHTGNYSYDRGATIADPSDGGNYLNRSAWNRSNKSLSFNSIRDFCHFSRRNKLETAESNSFLYSSNFKHWFKNWPEKRKHKLTASTFASAIGFWPDERVQLWLEKIGAVEPFSGSLATCWSCNNEEDALERYKLITGNSVVLPEFQVYGKNVEDDWLAASPDGLVDMLVSELPSRGVLEIKCPFFNGEVSNSLPWERIPLYCIPQAQGLMEITGRDWMDFYVWTPNGSSLFRLDRNVKYWKAMKVALSDFWWKHVQPAKQLMREYAVTDPLKQLQPLKPEPRHELCGYILYESQRIVDSTKLLMLEIQGKLQS